MEKNIKISIGIFIILGFSRFIPHPPNFTSLLALSFYVPAVLGFRYTPALMFSFVITDYFIGFHNLTFFTWGSVFIIALVSKYFVQTIYKRIFGSLIGALIFFIISNFGVWLNGGYGLDLKGLIQCYYFAIPFFYYSIISTLIFASIFEAILKIKYLSKINIYAK